MNSGAPKGKADPSPLMAPVRKNIDVNGYEIIFNYTRRH